MRSAHAIEQKAQISRSIIRIHAAFLQPRSRSIVFLDHRGATLRTDLLNFCGHAIRHSLHAQDVQAAKAQGIGCTGLTRSIFNVLRDADPVTDQKSYGRAGECRPTAKNARPLHCPFPIQLVLNYSYHFGGKLLRIVPPVLRGTDDPSIPHSAAFFPARRLISHRGRTIAHKPDWTRPLPRELDFASILTVMTIGDVRLSEPSGR
jgi:hypothetical protein